MDSEDFSESLRLVHFCLVGRFKIGVLEALEKDIPFSLTKDPGLNLRHVDFATVQNIRQMQTPEDPDLFLDFRIPIWQIQNSSLWS